MIDAWVSDEALCVPIDASLYQSVERMTGPEPIAGLREGLAGLGLYAARRMGRAPSAKRLIEAVTSVQDRVGHRTDRGLTWNSPRAGSPLTLGVGPMS